MEECRLKTIDLIQLEGKWKMRRANSKAVLSKLLVKFFFLDVDETVNIYKKMTNVLIHIYIYALV